MPQGNMTGKNILKEMEEKKSSNFVEEKNRNQFIQCFQSTEGKEKM